MRSTFSAAFASLAIPTYRRLWLAGLFTFISVQMQFLLRGLLAWDLTEREGALGLTYLCFGVALLISTPLGGVASDRLSKRKVLLASQFTIVLASTVIGVPALLGEARFWMVLVSALFQGVAFGFFGPARVALSAEYVGREQLGNAIALTMLSMNGTRVFAPSLAGVLAGFALFGIGGALIVAAVMSVVAFALLAVLPADAPTETQPDRRSPLADISEGVSYVLARPPLRRLVISSFFVIMFGFNYVAFYPALIEGVFGLDEAWVGYASSASALGAVLVGIPLAGKADSPLAKPAMVIGGLLFGASVIAFGLAPNFWLAAAAVAVVGASTTVYQSLSNTRALTIADAEHQGRVQSLMQLSFAGFGIAAAPLGLLAESLGLRQAIVAMGVVTMGAVVAYALGEYGPDVLVGRRNQGSDTADGPAPVGGVPGPESDANVGDTSRDGSQAIGPTGRTGAAVRVGPVAGPSGSVDAR